MRHARTVATLSALPFKSIVQRQSGAQIGGWLAQQLDHMGPTYVKIGQFISARKDIFGDEFSAPFSALRDRVRPMPPAVVRSILDCAVRPGVIERVDEEPLAAASIGQVHRAVLKGGQQVVVKVRRPGVKSAIEEDIGFIRALLNVMSTLGLRRNVDKVLAGLQDFEAYLAQEVDFRREVSNMLRFHKVYVGDQTVRIPRVYASLCGEDVIVMERLDAMPLVPSDPSTRQDLARRLMDLFVRQLVNAGIVHGDPHPGNLGVDSQGRIIMYDFGNVVEVTLEERMRLKELICQLLLGNNPAVVQSLRRLGAKVTDASALDEYINLYRDYMRTIDVSLLRESAARHDPEATLPLELTDKMLRLIRVYGMLEGICKDISPDFNYFDLLDTYVEDLMSDDEFVAFKVREDVGILARRAGSAARELANLVALDPDAPAQKESGASAAAPAGLELVAHQRSSALALGALLGYVLAAACSGMERL